MKIYVAGASKEIDTIERYVRVLRDIGHVITHDWCAEIRKVGDANPVDIDREQCAEFALADLKGVYGADVLWMLVPESNSAGCWVELGYALALTRSFNHPQIIISGNHKRSIFCAISEIQLYDDHDFALQAICRYAT